MQEILEDHLSDLDRWIAPDDVESDVFWNVLEGTCHHVRQAECAGVVSSECTSPVVDIHRPDPTRRSSERHGQAEGAGATSEIEELTRLWQNWSRFEKDSGSRVQAMATEHSSIGDVFELEIRQGDSDRPGIRTCRRIRIRVVGVASGGSIAGGSGHGIGSLSRVSYEIRTFGDPVLVTRAAEVTDINGKIVRMVEDMFDTLYDSDSGIGLAAPQVGIQRQIFVWDMEDDPQVIINPAIVESDGEWVYDEGCLSIPGLFVEMTRPKTVLMRGVDLDGNEIEIEADELEARLFQHELDHLNGVLMFDRMQPEQRSRAMAEYKRITEQGVVLSSPVRLEAE